MKKLMFILPAFLMIGCGHNVMTYTTGKYLNLGYDPNNSKLGIQYINGESMTVVEKDNAKLEMETTDKLDGDGKVTARTTTIKYEIKDQTTGYDVELAKAKKDDSL